MIRQSPMVRIIEVGPRDGLQSLNARYSVETRQEWIQKLSLAGIQEIECGAFVRPDRVPAMANSDQVFESLGTTPFRKWALIPNRKGLQRALEVGADALAFFTSATEEFSLKNTACTRDESLIRFHDLVSEAKQFPLRAYLSCCFECPYEGIVDPAEVINMARKCIHAGATEIVVSDTIGSAQPEQVRVLMEKLNDEMPLSMLAIHLHNTRGHALDCAKVAWESGVKAFDASAGGLGGCPFAPGASGNVSTESLVELFHGMQVTTGIDLPALKQAQAWFSSQAPLST